MKGSFSGKFSISGLAGLTALAAAALLSGCTVGPNYRRPGAPSAPAFKEGAVPMPPPNPPNGGWKQVSPNDSALRGNWWEMYNDPQLNQLEERLAISNQTLRASYQAFLQAVEAVRVARSQYFPSVGVAPTATREQFSSNRPFSSQGSQTKYSDLVFPGQAAWEPDLWGAIRRQVESQRATAQATAADLANVELSLRTELAMDYFEMRGLDSEQTLLNNAVDQYQQYYDVTVDRLRGGVDTADAVELADTQLQQTKAQAVDVGVARAQYEHAIAVLIGTPASNFSLADSPLTLPLPQIPIGVPSQLLERRPDIAAAERRVDAANAQIGVAISAFYPTITLGGTGGFESQNPGTWFQGPSTLWSLGGSAAELLFAGGRRHALTDEARAAYEQNVANYRETVLVSFQEVEDNLAALRILNSESVTQGLAVQAAERSLKLSTDRYNGGVTNYLEVIIAQTAQLTNQLTATTINTRQFAASVLLVEALGGGWDVNQLPRP